MGHRTPGQTIGLTRAACFELSNRGMTIRDLICWIVAWTPASYANELGVFDFALVELPNERKTSTNGGTLAPALDEGACFVKAFEEVKSDTSPVTSHG